MVTVHVLEPREVALGDESTLVVRRTLPHRDRPFVGAWCFSDHYGPNHTGPDNEDGMDVPPHPHTGLSTVSWLFEGELEHRDTAGNAATIRPGEVNLMTAGHGIAHSEVSAPDQTLRGVQLWVLLPKEHQHTEREFQHHEPDEHTMGDGAAKVRVFVGEIEGIDASPITTYTPLLGAEINIEPNASVVVPLNRTFEHGVLVDDGDVDVEGTKVGFGGLGIFDLGCSEVRLTAGAEGARLVLVGGEPFEEEVIMWWNFVASDSESIAKARQEWEDHSERFGQVEGYEGKVQHLPAPPLPAGNLKTRSRRDGATPSGAEPPACS